MTFKPNHEHKSHPRYDTRLAVDHYIATRAGCFWFNFAEVRTFGDALPQPVQHKEYEYDSAARPDPWHPHGP